ncbi:MAG: RpiB/LacA/LacB family sugar-phosphate isomerase, partial [Calditrichia bacterium]
ELKESKAMDIVDVWLNTSFEGGRHQRRVDLINKLTGL